MYEFRCSVIRVFLCLKQNETDKVAASATVKSVFMRNRLFIEPENHLFSTSLTFLIISSIVNTQMYEFKCSVTRVFLRLKQNVADKEAASATVESALKANRSFIEPENHLLPSYLTFPTI